MVFFVEEVFVFGVLVVLVSMVEVDVDDVELTSPSVSVEVGVVSTVEVVTNCVVGFPTLQISDNPTSLMVPFGLKSSGTNPPQKIFPSPPYQIAELDGLIRSDEPVGVWGCP